ncbi:glycosyltransferase family 2 protein [Angustibacter luteus]|uniref:Glycosyltransferase family 2 protein n=1 Tax=Angustibacter luteus TaxID=658456 RepID=A0ABW1JC95_9ACTN
MSAQPQAPAHVSRLGVVVVNYASHQLLADRLPALRALEAPHDVVVVDNLTTGAERSAVGALAHQHGWQVIEADRNLGFGGGMNLGVARAAELGCDAVLLLNPDVDVDPAVVEALLDGARRHPGALVSPRIVLPGGRTWFSGGVLQLATGDLRAGGGPDLTARGSWLTAACLLVPLSTWRAVGGFDDRYFMYWEDVDLSWRAAQQGLPLVVLDDVEVVHHVGGTQSGDAKSPLYFYFNCRNRLLFAAKNLPRRERLRWLLATPRASWRVLRRHGGRKRILRSPRVVLGAVRGTLAGVGALLRPTGAGAG